MNPTHKLELSDVPKHLRGLDGYAGRTFRAEVTGAAFIPSDAGVSDGGTRSTFFGVHLESGRIERLPGQCLAPWDRSRQDQRVELLPGFAIVERVHFCGKDRGLRFYVHPADVARVLPAPKAEGGAS